MTQEAPGRYYVTADGKVVEEGDENAAQLIFVEGQEFDAARLTEFGPNVAKDLKALIDKPAKKAAPEPEDKAVEAPSENKSKAKE